MADRRRTGKAARGGVLQHSSRVVVLGFAAVAAVGTAALTLPVAAESGTSTDLVPSLFTAVSALCVTGLIVVDTRSHWSTFGELVILGLIQLGGLGIMTLASLLGLLVAHKMGLRLQLTAQAETKAPGLGDVRAVVGRIVALSLVIEAVVAVVLGLRFGLHYPVPPGRAAYLGVFHAVSAFNNAGFTLFPDNLVPIDVWITVPIMVAVILGGIGFPVLFELGRHLRTGHHRWTLHVKITVGTYALLLAVGIGWFLLAEWRNPRTLGPLSIGAKLLVGSFHGVTPRSAGFNIVDVGEFRPSTMLLHDVLMFIGGGSAGTAGGIKVTTFALLAFVILAEVRGQPTVHVLGRRLPPGVQRQALTIALLAVGLVVSATLVLLAITPFRLDEVLFDVISAFGTVGLSTGVTEQLPAAGQLVLTALMFLGRLGPVTLASALAVREHTRRYELPEERPIVG